MNENLDFESSPDAYQVKLDAFEGPLDLLLHLIRKNELNIYDIPIALITEQYLGYITLMQDLNLDVAGEFLVMASTLIHIKSRMLLPRPDAAQDDAGPEERLGGTIAACLWCAAQGADVLRVHDVRAVRQALSVTEMLTPARAPEAAHA